MPEYEHTFEVPGEKELTDGMDRFLTLLCNNWRLDPECRLQLTQYLLNIYRELTVVPDPILALVGDQLLAEEREIKPTLDYIRLLCVAGMKIRPYLHRRLGMIVDPAEEPRLPPRQKGSGDKRRRVRLDD
jgi:hypothetical protein